MTDPRITQIAANLESIYDELKAADTSGGSPPAASPSLRFGGRLTLRSGAPVVASDVIGSSVLYYTPYVGDTVPVFNGTSWSNVQFTEETITVAASPGPADIFFSLSGLMLLPWGSARPALSRVNGILVLATNDWWTYLGSINRDANGLLNTHLSYGQRRRWDVWNCYNRKRILLRMGNPLTASYQPTWLDPLFGPANNNPNNSLIVFAGLAEEPCRVTLRNTFFLNSAVSGAGTMYMTAIGWNMADGQTVSDPNTTGATLPLPEGPPHGFRPLVNTLDVGGLAVSGTGSGEYDAPPFVGPVQVVQLETHRGNGGVTAYGREMTQLMTAEWWG